MPTPETQVALTNLAAIQRGRVLVCGFGPDLARALPDAVVFHQDLRSYRAAGGHADVRFGAWLETDDRFDSVVVESPKAVGRLRMLLAMARSVMAPGAHLFLIGHNDAGIRSAGSHLRAVIGEPEVLDYRAHCRMYRVELAAREGIATTLADCRAEFIADAGRRTLQVRSYPGVFAHGRLDDATAILLDRVDLPAGSRVADIGCGSGIIGAWAATHDAEVTCVDVDAVALRATEETLELNDVHGEVRPSDVYSDIARRFTHILTNAPFHAGVRTTSAVGVRVIEQAPEHLERGGALWMVANRFLDYLTPLRGVFDDVGVEYEDNRWRVYRAARA